MQAFHYIIVVEDYIYFQQQCLPKSNTDLLWSAGKAGLSDQQWCLDHDIKSGTFYNWVKRLRQRGGYDIPAPARRFCKEAPKQEVVRLEFNENRASVIEASYPRQTLALPVMELSIGKVSLRISNEIDQVLLAHTIKALKELAC